MGFWTAPRRDRAMREHHGVDAGRELPRDDGAGADPDAREPGGHPFGPVAEGAEGEDLVVRADEHRMVGRRVGAARHELPHGPCSGQGLVGRHLVSFWPHLGPLS